MTTLRVAQLRGSATDGDVLTTVAGVPVWQSSSASTMPLLSDDDANPLAAEDGSDWLYPDP